MEARRLLLVKGAEADVAAPALRELDARGDDLDDVRVATDAVERLLADHDSTPTTGGERALD
jgi:hypothetical protein